METTELIEKYLEGSLTTKEMAAVNSRAASDEEFRKLIDLHREVNEGIADTELYDLHKKLETLSAGYTSEISRARKKGLTFYLLRIAALLIFVAGSSIMLQYVLSPQPVELRLYSRYYRAYNADVVARSAELSGTFSQGVEKYDIGDYPRAFSIFSEIVKNDPDNYLAWFYRGLTGMELNDNENAIISFSKIPDDWNSPFLGHRNWYYALSLLKQQKTPEALVILEGIISSDGFYSDDAEKIISRLSR